MIQDSEGDGLPNSYSEKCHDREMDQTLWKRKGEFHSLGLGRQGGLRTDDPAVGIGEEEDEADSGRINSA